jgi:hypothetical protein
LETLVDAATRRIGDHRPLADFFFSFFPQQKREKRGHIASNTLRNSFFGHNHRLFTDVLDPPLVGEEGQNLLLWLFDTEQNSLFLGRSIEVLLLVQDVRRFGLEQKKNIYFSD